MDSETRVWRPGKYVALAAIAGFVVLLGFVLFYGGDRPSEDPRATVTPSALNEERAALPPEEETPLIEPYEPELEKPETRQPATRGAKQTPASKEVGRVMPKAELDRPGLQLGGKPLEARALALGDTDQEDGTGRPIPADDIRAVVGRHEQAVKSCYRGSEAASGKLEVAILVEPSGEVSDAKIKSRPLTPESECVTEKARSWKFPAPGGEAPQEVVVPFVIVEGTG